MHCGRRISWELIYHRQQGSRKRKTLDLEWALWNLKAHPDWHTLFNVATPHTLFKYYKFSVDQVFKYMCLWMSSLLKSPRSFIHICCKQSNNSYSLSPYFCTWRRQRVFLPHIQILKSVFVPSSTLQSAIIFFKAPWEWEPLWHSIVSTNAHFKNNLNWLT